MGFGAFIEITPNKEGLLHISEIDHSYVEEITDYFEVGDHIRVKLTEIQEDGKYRLTHKPFAQQNNPWDDFEEKYSAKETAKGKVDSIADFGAFVELEPGVQGLLHISKMAGSGYVDKHPAEIVSVGQEVEVEILNIDAEEQRMSFRLRRVLGGQEKEIDETQGKTERVETGLERERLMIDGLNVCYWAEDWTECDGKASMDVLLTLLLALGERGYDFTCTFDASTPHRLGEHADDGDVAIYKRLRHTLSEIDQVPGGSDADDYLLQSADREGLRVIAQDRYKDKREQYPWLESKESDRLIKGVVTSQGYLQLPHSDFDIYTPVRTDTQDMADELVGLLGQ